MRFTPATLRNHPVTSFPNWGYLVLFWVLMAFMPAFGRDPTANKSTDDTPGRVSVSVQESYWGPLRMPLVPAGVLVASDPIRFSIQCSSSAVRIGESIDLTVTAELLNIAPNLLFFLPGSNAYTLKMLLPPGFEQTGGDFTGYVTGELSYPSRALMTYHIRGFFRSVTPGTGFRLLRGQGQQPADQGLFVEKAAVDLKTPPDERLTTRPTVLTGQRGSGISVLTLFVIPDQATATGAPRLQATTAATATPLVVLAPTYNCSTGAITFNTSGGDGTSIRYRANGITGWTTNPNQFLDAPARTDSDTPPFTIYVEQSGTTLTYVWSRQATCSTTTPPTPVTVTPPITTTVTPPGTTTTASALTVLAPTYNCATGAITFNTSGGDGTTIRYQANGITGWTTNPNQFLDAGARTAADTPPFTIYVEQSGRTLTYIWSRQAACSTTTPPTPVTVTPPITTTVTPPGTTTTASALTVLAPTYNCATGAITFNTSGGDGTTIRYQANGITGWTTNPNQFLDAGARTAADTPPFTIYVEQSGRTLTYVWSRQVACSTITPPTPVTVTPPITTTVASPTAASAGNCIAFEPVCSGNAQEVRIQTINVATAGSYSLVISYRSPEGDIDGILRINGVPQAIRLNQANAYTTVTTATLTLKAGDNAIGLSSGVQGGYVCFNSICVSSPPPPPTCAFVVSANSLNATCGQPAVQLTATCVGTDCGTVSYNWSGNGLAYSGQTVNFDAPANNISLTYTVTASRLGCANKTATGTITVTGCGATLPGGYCTINDYSAETDINYNP